MTDSINDFPVPQTAALLMRYGFELKGYTAQEAIARWLQVYPAKWVRLAVVEALYLGRYKAKSVESILEIWLRRGQPRLNFSYEFERLIATSPVEESSTVVERAYKRHESAFEEQPSYTQEEKIQPHASEAQIPTASENYKMSADEFAQTSHHLSNPSMRSLSYPEMSPKDTFNSQGAIHQFTPSRDNSEFYSKLKTVLQRGLEERL